MNESTRRQRPGRPMGTGRNGCIRFLTEEELRCFLRVASRSSRRDDLLFTLIAHLGLRPVEASRLTLSDFDTENRVLTIRGIEYPDMAKPVWNKLGRYLRTRKAGGENPFVFVHRSDKARAMPAISIQRQFKVIAGRAGVAGHSVIDMRHTCGLNLALQGRSVEEIANHLRLRFRYMSLCTRLANRYIRLAEELTEHQHRAEKALENFFRGKVRYRTYFPNFTKGEMNA